MKFKYKMLSYFFSSNQKSACHNVLSISNSYYRDLNKNLQKTFRIRTLLFIKTTNFKSTKGFELNDRMKFIIAGAFVQITFGLKVNSLAFFNVIFITPQPYSYRNNESLFQGDVNLKTKRINMSWPSIEQGFDIHDDALNLAIHEFGHCILFENIKNRSIYPIFKENDFENWKKEALRKYEKINNNENIVLRSYAGTNLVELFSVALEAFFEKPHYFEKHEPALYQSMTMLLKQNPINKQNPLEL